MTTTEGQPSSSCRAASAAGIGGDTVVAVELELDDDGIADEELTALALAADPEQPVGTDAVPIALPAAATSDLLPEWYMPAPMSGARRGTGRRIVLAGVALLLVVINGAGLCVTYGVPEIAW